MWDVKSESHIAYPIVKFPDFLVNSLFHERLAPPPAGRGSLRERRSGMDNGVCQEKPNKLIYSRPCDDSARGSPETSPAIVIDKPRYSI